MGLVQNRQSQGRYSVDMADPRMGDDLPSLYLVDQSDSTGPGVAPGEPHSKRPSLSGPVDDIGSVVALVGWSEEGSIG